MTILSTTNNRRKERKKNKNKKGYYGVSVNTSYQIWAHIVKSAFNAWVNGLFTALERIFFNLGAVRLMDTESSVRDL
jgi:hypothetical protein